MTTSQQETRPADTGAGPVAEVADLAVTFRRGGRAIHALRGVSLDIRQGEILGLVGESGSGKSVLGMSLLGLLPTDPPPKTAGSVSVCGEDMLAGPAAGRWAGVGWSGKDPRRRVRREELGAVFQDPMTSLNPTMRVGRQIMEATGSPDETVRLLRAVGVPEPERRVRSFPHELSGGLRQRVMIAMAVAGRPALIVADEPTTALDVTVQAQVLALLRSLRDEIGCGVLLITHDLGVAAQVADRVAVMYGGRLAELGPTATVLREAAHPYSIGLMRSRLSLASSRSRPPAGMSGEPPNPAAPPPGCPFEPRCALATERCTAEPPPAATEVAPGHLSACLLPPAEVAAGLGARGQERAAAPAAERAAVPAAERAAAPENATNEPDPAAVRADGLVKTFPVRAPGGHRLRLQALRGVDLEVAPGEAVAIVGESGSGKSTLLRLVAGLDRPDRGDVAHGADRTRPQMVFQDAGASLTPWLTVGELIGERLRGRRSGQRLGRAERRRRVAAALAQVGLPAEVAGARAGQLSGGQRQRVALARAIVIPPAVLLCDEPTSALDVSLAASVVGLIARLRRELGMAVLFVTHDLSVARIVADRIAVMYLGKIVESGAADDVVNRPRHPYTRALISAVPDFGVEPAALAGEPASPLRPPAGCAFHPRCPVAEPVCADRDLELRLVGVRPEPGRMVACIRTGAV